jgi:hypothetical protein
MRYVIAGFGKFGRIALERLVKSIASARITVLDPSPVATAGFSPTVQWVAEDAVAFLANATDVSPQDVIVPMVPFHLAASWIVARSSNVVPIPLPDSLRALLPHPFPLDASTVCASRADFFCPDDCPEGHRCSVTGMVRDPLFSAIAGISLEGMTVLVLRSLQILPGVGGYTFGELVNLEQRMRGGRYVVATSCKCHAILTALEKA